MLIDSITGDATAQQFFAVNSRGEIYLIRSPEENQAISAFNMIVDVRDQGLPTIRPANPNPAYVIINVIRNANPPVFFTREYNRVIPENTTIGQSVERVVATDADTQGNFGILRYSIIGDGTADDIFQINENSGNVSVKTSLTTTPINDFTVRIVAQDGGSPPRSATALLYVTVTRNFARPLWSSATYATSIPETAPVLENILRVTATDSDAQPPDNEVSYELVGDAIQLYYFEIVSSTGDIRPRRPLTLDTSRRNRFDFVVNARDNGSPRLSAAFNATVTISVYRNNNAPRFIQDPYSITVNQGLGSGTVISVKAVDDDPNTEFNQITYSIEGPANALALFTIDGSGNIQPTNPAAINRASQTSYKAPYNTVQYEINSPLSSPLGRLYFMVDPNTGDVSLRCYLESDTSYTSVYTLVVDAVDGSGRRANRSANVKITVDRKTPLQPPKDNNTMSFRASVCCQEPQSPYWGGSSKTYIT